MGKQGRGKVKRAKVINVWLSAVEAAQLKRAARTSGTKSVSAFLRKLISTSRLNGTPRRRGQPEDIQEALKTSLGSIYCGDSLTLMRSVLADKSVDLIMTSP